MCIKVKKYTVNQLPHEYETQSFMIPTGTPHTVPGIIFKDNQDILQFCQ